MHKLSCRARARAARRTPMHTNSPIINAAKRMLLLLQCRRSFCDYGTRWNERDMIMFVQLEFYLRFLYGIGDAFSLKNEGEFLIGCVE